MLSWDTDFILSSCWKLHKASVVFLRAQQTHERCEPRASERFKTLARLCFCLFARSNILACIHLYKLCFVPSFFSSRQTYSFSFVNSSTVGKLVIVGDRGVGMWAPALLWDIDILSGKTAYIRKLASGNFVEEYTGQYAICLLVCLLCAQPPLMFKFIVFSFPRTTEI